MKPFSSCFVAEMLTAELFVEGADLGRDTLTSHERAYARFQIVLVLGKEVWPYARYTRDGRRSFCAWVVFLPKTARTQSWECCAHMFGRGLPFNCVEIVHVNVDFSCNCMKYT